MIDYILIFAALACLVALIQKKMTLGLFLFAEVILVGLWLTLKEIMLFPMFLLLVLVFTGAIWLIDILFLKKKRSASAPEPEAVEYAKSFFPVILLVFLIRSFIAEPFKIPSGSMMPTLLAGDYILVNKFTYGLRVPIANNIFFEVNHPKHGDVFVFHYPPNPKVDYIKRVIGLPGDKIEYLDKKLTINGKPAVQNGEGDYEYQADGANIVVAKRAVENLDGKIHDILIEPDEPPVNIGSVEQFPFHENCSYNESGFVCTVPAGNYLAMGDNRDNSRDSRYWGFVPENNLVGKAFFIWFNFGEFGRIGHSVE
jgi:signal peptidase I